MKKIYRFTIFCTYSLASSFQLIFNPVLLHAEIQSKSVQTNNNNTFAPSFDCNKASTVQDRLVCGDQDLARLDVELNSVYLKSRSQSQDKDVLKKNQLDWLRYTKNACNDKLCIERAYKQRIEELSKTNSFVVDKEQIENNKEVKGQIEKPKSAQTIIEEHDKKTKQDNIKIAESSGDYSRSNPAPKQEKFTFSSPDGKINVDVEIKGIKIGMSAAEVGELVLSSVSTESHCVTAQILPDHPNFFLGDYGLQCDQSYQYFGSPVKSVNFYFINDKLKYGVMAYFRSINENGDPLPKIVRSLVENKFKGLPKVIANEHSTRGSGTFQFTWIDPNGNRFTYDTEFQSHIGGFEHKDGTISLSSADYEQYTEDRRKMLRDAALIKQQSIENKQKSDL